MPFIIVAINPSAMPKASFSGLLPASSTSFWFSITITVSQTSLNFAMPSSALFILAPSILKGSVTAAITIAPISLARYATTGADPVPVPPPSPHVRNSKSQPWRDSLMSFLDSSAAFLPTSGKPPAPIPLVSSLPSRILFVAFVTARCLASVLAAMVPAPCTPSSVSLLTVLHPPPPQPTTMILACSTWKFATSSFMSMLIPPFYISCIFESIFHEIYFSIKFRKTDFVFDLIFFPLYKHSVTMKHISSLLIERNNLHYFDLDKLQSR